MNHFRLNAAPTSILVTLILCGLGGSLQPCLADDTDTPANLHAELLRSHGIGSETQSLIAYLIDRRPAADIDRLIRELGSNQFAVRRRATQQLIRIGEPARKQLTDATRHHDREIVKRAHIILMRIGATHRAEVDESLLLAVMQLLKQRQTVAAVDPLLQLLPSITKRYIRELAAEVIWHSLDQSQLESLQTQLASRNASVVATAVVAVELLQGKQSSGRLEKYFEDKRELVRLAAARALINHRPQQSLKVLVSLLDSSNAETRRQSAHLLRLLSGQKFGIGSGADDAVAARKWQEWSAADINSKNLKLPVDRRRLDTKQFHHTLHEAFAVDETSVTNGYRRFSYQSTVESKASIRRSLLRLDGDHAEGDQRLFVTASRLLGTNLFPDDLLIKTTIGGEAANAGGWHVGVSVGNVRVLFHPGYSGGGFRLERVDNHQYLTSTVNIGFTPQPGNLYEQTIRLRAADSRNVRLLVTLTNPQNPQEAYRKSFSVERTTIGPLNRIGLERSGRTGGAALFGSVLIQAEPPADPPDRPQQ